MFNPPFKVMRNFCDCHPETCCCKTWKVVDSRKEQHSTHMQKDIAEMTAQALNAFEKDKKGNT